MALYGYELNEGGVEAALEDGLKGLLRALELRTTSFASPKPKRRAGFKRNVSTMGKDFKSSVVVKCDPRKQRGQRGLDPNSLVCPPGYGIRF